MSMFRALDLAAFALAASLVPAAAFAQQSQNSQTMHHQMMHRLPKGQAAPMQPGQDAFAAIQEIVAILEADPKTDWSKVDIDALRSHLVDMNAVMMAASVTEQPIDGGMKFAVTGSGPTRDSIRRMVNAHAATMNGVGKWRFVAADTEDGATLSVFAPEADRAKLHGLGFFGILTVGMHHQEHHMMIARGENPHG
jgi:hypothetical protein